MNALRRLLQSAVCIPALILLLTAHACGGAAKTSPEMQILEKLIARHDRSGDGLDRAETKRLLEAVAAQYGEKWRGWSRRTIGRADADGNGTLDRAEWRRFIADSRAETAAGVETRMVAMSDGVRLATDVALPAGKGPWPVILTRTPYNKDRQSRWAGTWTRNGYAFVVQDMRGRFASAGENLPFIGCGWGTHTDGADTVAWILKQPWCNGKIGTVGASAGGITQNLMAGAAPAGLDAQYIVVAAASLYHHAAYTGGALRRSQVVGWTKGNRFDPRALEQFAAHPRYDRFWHDYDSTRKHGAMNVPAVHVGGWFDTFAQGTIDSFTGRHHHGGPGARGRQKLVMGPWTHGIGRTRAGALVFPGATVPARYGRMRWFDATLKGAENAAADAPAVAYYVMGDCDEKNAPGNAWRYADDWPIPAAETPWYLHTGGGLTREPPGAAAPAFVAYTFDPSDPCPTVGGRNLTLPAGPRDQRRKVESRDDVLTFTSAPLANPVEITGRIRATIYVSSSAADTDLSVRFCDVYPDGRSYLMAEGMQRLRFRDSLSRPAPLEPGRIYAVTVDCWSLSLVVNAGHRLRVSVTSSNYPRYDVNPGTGAPHAKGCPLVDQANRIYCDADHPTRIVLPVVDEQ